MRITFSSEKEVNYDKIRQIVRETVKEELHKQEQPALLTKEDIQDAVCDGILQAENKKVEMEQERIKNTKVSLGTKLLIMIHILCAVFFVILTIIYAAFVTEILWINRLSICMKLVLMAGMFIFLAYAEYAVGKNNDHDFAFNMLTILLTVFTLVVSLIQYGG